MNERTAIRVTPEGIVPEPVRRRNRIRLYTVVTVSLEIFGVGALIAWAAFTDPANLLAASGGLAVFVAAERARKDTR